MGKIQVLADEDQIERVMKLYDLASEHEAIDFALQSVAGSGNRLGMLAMKGTGWEGDLRLMRGLRHESP